MNSGNISDNTFFFQISNICILKITFEVCNGQNFLSPSLLLGPWPTCEEAQLCAKRSKRGVLGSYLCPALRPPKREACGWGCDRSVTGLASQALDPSSLLRHSALRPSLVGDWHPLCGWRNRGSGRWSDLPCHRLAGGGLELEPWFAWLSAHVPSYLCPPHGAVHIAWFSWYETMRGYITSYVVSYYKI